MFNGFVVKNYEFIRLIGSGGMGEIWSARRVTLGDIVAIKILKTHKYEDLEKAFKNFEKEAKATSIIHHPNVCKVYDFFEENNNYFLVMEYLEGFDLGRALLMNKAQTEDNYKFALYVCRQVLRALNVAHNLKTASVNKILHRDIKPANIFLTIHNEIKLLDLGIAKIETDFDNTRTTEIGYSKNYSSPDLWEGDVYMGERYAENHDIYSLSLVFLEICKDNIPGIASQHFKDVISKWNAVKQDERIQTSGEILKEVEVECERLAVNDLIIRKFVNFENRSSSETLKSFSASQPKTKNRKKVKIAFGVAASIAVFVVYIFGKSLLHPAKRVFNNDKQISIYVPEKDWTVKLGPLSESQFDISAMKCRISEEQLEECSYTEGKDAPGDFTFRIRMDLEKNIQTAYYGVYGDDEGKALTKKVRQDLKERNYVFDSDINGYLAKGSIVILGTIGKNFYSVTLDQSDLFDLQQAAQYTAPKTLPVIGRSAFYFNIPADELKRVKLGLFPNLYEIIKPYANCSKWSDTETNCTLATNKAQQLFNEEDFKVHLAFENGETTFVQYSFRTDGAYTNMINKISKSKDLIRGRHEINSKYWYSESEGIEISKVTFNKMQAYTLTIRKMTPEKLAEAIESGFVEVK